MIINMILDYIESLILVTFIAYFTDVSKKSYYIFISSLIGFFIMELFSMNDVYGNVLILFEVITFNVLIIIFNKRWRSIDLIGTLLSYFLLAVSIPLSLGLCTIVIGDNLEILITNNKPIVTIVSKVILVTIDLIVIYFKNRIKDKVIGENKALLIFIFSMMFGIYSISLLMIGTGEAVINDIYLIIIMVSVEFVAVSYLFYNMNLINQKNIKNEQKIQQLKYIEKNITTIDFLHKNTKNIQHVMYYVLMGIEGRINKGDKDGALKILNKFKDDLSKSNNVLSTKNYFLDSYFNDYLFYLKSAFNTDIKVMVSISKNDIYNNLNQIKTMISVMDSFFREIDNSLLEINIIEYQYFFEYKLVGVIKNVDNNPESNLLPLCENVDCNIAINDNLLEMKMIFELEK